ncbi:SOS response-associated peptidase [Rhodovulum steppense]|uniref:Abasic site processing protein n=1 Tax=Rhodovulum steppense TaxID=540251 RepID=A0A4R1YZG4_9RHOB|nr:SOS response-associated peptidase [Rhodovulum steppense]TCM86567.1 putative SOS response-associated peptidase YedK [Rhodovulum steppense]
MCGRFAITLPVEAMAKLFEAMPANDLPEGPNYNVCPTNPVAAVTGEGGMRRLRALRWGFVPHWYKTPTDGPLLINARADTIATKPAFAEAARRRRCLIPASGFYEWSKAADGARLPWYVRRADGAPMAMAGIWKDWEREGQRLSTCAIVTTEANPAMAAIHHRMPVIVERADWPLWLGEAGHGAAVLMRPAAEGVLAVHRVGVAVNSNRAAGPGLIAPVAT